ncbi:MAG: septal ring lytic transglycosylase RlpA family protein [Deltaproteobacteria bacterium]|nr:septal ring lytic transglycosylase RlpA family protein [Deltaproteobacteria bacterium]
MCLSTARHAIATALALGVAAGCAHSSGHVLNAPQPATLGAYAPYQIGLASYYHDSLAGNLTANGERYDPTAATAAHRTLPLGTVLDVVRRDGRAVRVRVNDRGPYVDGRILDLSRGAATALDMLRAGVVEVALYLVYVPPARERRRVPRR